MLIQAGQFLDRPGHPARDASTIVIREGRVLDVRDVTVLKRVSFVMKDGVVFRDVRGAAVDTPR